MKQYLAKQMQNSRFYGLQIITRNKNSMYDLTRLPFHWSVWLLLSSFLAVFNLQSSAAALSTLLLLVKKWFTETNWQMRLSKWYTCAFRCIINWCQVESKITRFKLHRYLLVHTFMIYLHSYLARKGSREGLDNLQNWHTRAIIKDLTTSNLTCRVCSEAAPLCTPQGVQKMSYRSADRG